MSFSFGNYNPADANVLANIREVQEKIYPKLTHYHQRVRFGNYKREMRYHLLDVERFPDNYTLSISGRSANIYQVKIDETTRQVTCSCPDGHGYCRHKNTICKHAYFVLIKVLMMKELSYETSNFFQTNQLSEEEKELAFARLYSVWENREGAADFMNTDFINQFQHHKEKQQELAEAAKKDDKPTDVLGKFKVESLPEDQDACLVCYCEMEKPKEIVKCPDCRKVFHTDCLHRWFNTGKETCVHCRSPVWKEYITALRQELDSSNPYAKNYENLYHIIRY